MDQTLNDSPFPDLGKGHEGNILVGLQSLFLDFSMELAHQASWNTDKYHLEMWKEHSSSYFGYCLL